MADQLSKRQLKRLVKEQRAEVNRDPNNLVARLKLAGVLRDLGRNSEAVEHYLEVGKSYSEAGKTVQAISVYKGILEIAPGHPETEAALTELSAQRTEEIKRKSMPRLQQVEGRWIMPTEEDVSEEEGTDPGKAPPESGGGATPSVLRLPATPSMPPGGAKRRSRRSRSRISRPDLATDSSPGAPKSDPVLPVAPLPDGWSDAGPRDLLPPQPSLPGLLDSPAGPSPLPPADSETRSSHPPAPTVPSRRTTRASREGSAPKTETPLPLPKEPDSLSDAEVRMTAEAPEDAPSEKAFEELTSPGPDGYDSTIRQSMPRIDVSAVAPRATTSESAPKRSTLVGVPLPDHPSFTPRDLADPQAHVRPTPSMPLPAIRRFARSAENEESAALAASPQEVQGPPDDIGADTPEPVDESSEDVTLAMRKAPPVPEVSFPLREQTLDDVFGDEEDAAWEALAGLAPPQSREEDDEGASKAPTAPVVSRPTLPLQPTDSRPLSSGPEKPGVAGRASRGTLLMTPTSASPAPLAAEPPASPGIHTSRAPGAHKPETSRADQARSAQSVPLESIPLFRDLSEPSRELLRSRVIVRRERAGALIVSEGEPGNAFFVVSEGEVDVTKRSKSGSVHLATLGPGTFFGEFALLSDRRRHATVTVLRDAVLLEISRKIISDLTKAEPAFGTTLRSFYRRRLLSTLVHSAPFFEPLSHEEQESLMGKLRFRRIPKGKRIVSQGESGGGFFLVLVGRVRVSTLGEDGKEHVLARLGDGAYFGEMSLLKGGKAVASIVSEVPTEIVQLQAAEFYRILSQYPQIWEEVNREANRRSLANHQILAGKAPHGLATDESVVM